MGRTKMRFFSLDMCSISFGVTFLNTSFCLQWHDVDGYRVLWLRAISPLLHKKAPERRRFGAFLFLVFWLLARIFDTVRYDFRHSNAKR